MKISVVSEGREGVWLPDRQSLKEWIRAQGFEQIHNMIPTGGMMIGADHSVDSVLDDIDRADRLGILTGEAAKGNIGHALSLIRDNKMEMYDIGEITAADLSDPEAVSHAT